MKTDIKLYGPETPGYALLNEAAFQEALKKIKIAYRGVRAKEKLVKVAQTVVPLLLLLLLVGCAHSATGLAHEQLVYQSATNSLSWLNANAIPLVPAPWNGVTTVATGIIGALLGAWNLSQQRRIKTLENNQPSTPLAGK
jgi:hypothetical protein